MREGSIFRNIFGGIRAVRLHDDAGARFAARAGVGRRSFETTRASLREDHDSVAMGVAHPRAPALRDSPIIPDPESLARRMLSSRCMTYAKASFLGVVGAVIVAVGSACSGIAASEDGPNGAPSFENPDAASEAADPGPRAPGAPSASGVVLVHAAAFPAFRLCFENMPELKPQPDSKIMPQANVVGVEVGSVVRLDPMKAPGRIYVMNERDVRTNDFTCGELLDDPSKKLVVDKDYHVANEIDHPLGEGRVDVLAITGCGGKAFLNYLETDETNCDEGASRKWDVTKGNLEARVIPLEPSPVGATESSLPVQLVQDRKSVV